MRSVEISELEHDLATYLDCARAGEELVIRDHDRPIARLVPVATPPAYDALSEEDKELVAIGAMRLPRKPARLDDFWDLPIAQLTPGPGMTATEALLEERREGR